MPLLEEPPPAPSPPAVSSLSPSPDKLHPRTPSPGTAVAPAIRSGDSIDAREAASPALPHAFALASSGERSCRPESAAALNSSSCAPDSAAASCSEDVGGSGASALSTATLRAALSDVAATRRDPASALPYLVSSPAASSCRSRSRSPPGQIPVESKGRTGRERAAIQLPGPRTAREEPNEPNRDVAEPPPPVLPLSSFDECAPLRSAIACDSSRLPFSSRATPQLATPPSLPFSSSSNAPSSTPTSVRPDFASSKPLPPLPTSRSTRVATPVQPWELVRMLEQSEVPGQRRKAPLLIDTRGLTAFLGDEGRNCAFPTLLCKRFSKGNISNFALSSFITTELGKSLYTAMSLSPSSSSARPIVVIDDKLDSQMRESLNPGAVLLSVLERRNGGEGSGIICYLDQPLSQAAKTEDALRRWVVLGESDDELVTLMSPSNPTPHLPFSSFPHGPTRLTALVPPPSLPSLPVPSAPVAAPLPPVILPPLLSPRASHSTATRQRPPPPKLRRIDTSENLLAAYAKPGTSSASVTSGVAARRNRSQSPAPRLHVNVQAAQLGNAPVGGVMPVSLHEMCHMQSKSPSAMATRFREAELVLPPVSASRSTSRSSPFSSTHTAALGASSAGLDPAIRPRTPDDPFDSDVRPPFDPSIILPGFLFLGQEPTCPSDLDELERLGVKQVLNLAVECEDKDDEVKTRFGRYGWLPMTDSVEEKGVQERLDEACRILADAQLQSKPVYVHCRAGKSRSVTVVLAYLVYRNHWSLKRAYSYVAERREGISPNLGFMAELMAFEERHHGIKSHGVLGFKTGFMPDSDALPTHRFQRSQTAAASYFTGSTRLPPGLSSDESAAGASPRSVPLFERTLSDQGGTSSGLASTLYTTSRAARAIRESMPPPSRVPEMTGSAENEERGATLELTLRERGRSGGEVERNREVRGADGTWVQARREARSETGEIDRR
ncbi:hypothetical protein JCM1841_006103 [Sporobolomyces salmonicolor]